MQDQASLTSVPFSFVKVTLDSSSKSALWLHQGLYLWPPSFLYYRCSFELSTRANLIRLSASFHSQSAAFRFNRQVSPMIQVHQAKSGLAPNTASTPSLTTQLRPLKIHLPHHLEIWLLAV